MQFKKALLLSVVLSSNVFAAPMQIVNRAINFQVSQKTLKVLKARVNSLTTNTALADTQSLPAAKQLGMNNIPVHDQGTLPNDAVFSSTAAFNAALGRGDYISQSCLLQLGNYMYSLNENDGGLLRNELSRLENYGFIMKKRQSSAGCDDPNKPFINYEDYHRFSKGLLDNEVIWSPLLDVQKALYERVDTGKTLAEIQQILNQGRRVTAGFAIQYTDTNDLGSVGTYHVKNDTWVLTAKIKRDLYSNTDLSYHSLIITGYDNEAVITDDEGQKHKGLLTLRGSWGKEMGDQGDFYMTYDYFRVLVVEAQQIIRVQENADAH